VYFYHVGGCFYIGRIKQDRSQKIKLALKNKIRLFYSKTLSNIAHNSILDSLIIEALETVGKNIKML